MMDNTDYLRQAMETYEVHRARLVNEGVGRHVLIRGDQIVGVWDTYDDALQAGYKSFGIDGGFVVKRIQGPIDGIQYFTRDIAACRV